MKIVERYVMGAFLSTLLLAWLVLSFVLTIGLLVKITELIMNGLPAHAVGLYLLVGFPETLTLTVPLSLLVSALLVFSRLSADGEIAAMRACGVNLLQVMRWPVALGAALTVLGIYVNQEIVPRGHEVRTNLKSLISVDAGLSMLEPGRMIDDFPGYKMYFKKRDGNWLTDVMIFDFSHPGVTREIRAEKALVSTNGADVVLDLYKARLDPVEADRPGAAAADRFRHVIPDAVKARAVKRKEKDQRFFELRQTIRDLCENARGLPRETVRKMLSVSRTEYQIRFVYAFASVIFVMIGMPLGIRAQRKESTVGMLVSLVVAMAFYLCVILFHSLDRCPAAQPYLLLWIPVVACGALAVGLVFRNL